MIRVNVLHRMRRHLLFDVYVHCALDEHKEVVTRVTLGEHGLLRLELQELALTTYRSKLRVRVRLQELALDDPYIDALNVCRRATRARDAQRSQELLEALPLATGHVKLVVDFVAPQPEAACYENRQVDKHDPLEHLKPKA